MKLVAGIVGLGIGVIIVLVSCLTDPEVVQWGNRLFDLCGLDDPAVRHWIFNTPKLWHVVFYGIFAFALMQIMSRQRLLAGLIAMAFGTVLEIAQFYVPTRSVNFSDLLFNLAGICLAFFLFQGIRRGKDRALKASS